MTRRSMLLLVLGTVLCTAASSAELEDSVPQLARALADLSADSSVVDLPEGLYTIESTWVISKPGVTIRGAGTGKTILMRDPKFNGVLVKIDAEGSTLSNLMLDGNGTATVLSLNGAGITADTLDIKNYFTTNTVAIIQDNTIADGGSLKAGGIEAGGGRFTVTGNTIRNHGSGGIGIGHNVIEVTITGNTISNCGQNVNDRNNPQNRSAIYVGYGATNVEISGNRCFDDQANKTQTWGLILAPPPRRIDPRFAPKATEHVVVRDNDLRGNLHREGLLDESDARDRNVSGNLLSQAN